MDGKRFRLSALFPLALSAISFALIVLLVLSGTTPDLIQDGYLLSINTTDVGKNAIQFSAASTTPTASAVQNGTSASSIKTARAAILHRLASSKELSNAISSNPQAINATAVTATTSSSIASAPTLAVPATTAAPAPANSGGLSLTSLNVQVLGVLFQVVLNSFASGMTDPLKAIVALVVTSTTRQLNVPQYYTLHISNICQGTVSNTTANLNSSSTPFNITDCPTYNNASSVIVNFTSTVPSSLIISAANVTVPLLQRVPALGVSTKTLIDGASGVVLGSFIISLIGSGFSIILSAVAIFLPSYSLVYNSAAAITTISTFVLQFVAVPITIFVLVVSSSINSLSDALGLTATVGIKFLLFMWFGFVAGQAANIYWTTIWFVEFRKRSYKARERTAQQIGNYKGISKEVLSDIRLQKVKKEEEGQQHILSISGNLNFRKSYYQQI